jgi:E3 ubiquitin-protein ligase DOA10
MHNAASWVWVLIPLAAIFAGTVRRWFRLKEMELEKMSSRVADQSANSAAETERLKQRVAVLERILTDRSTRLGDEIDRLRDQPIN